MLASAGEGDAFSLETFTCSISFPCKVSFWFLGLAWQGFADGFPVLSLLALLVQKYAY